MSLSTLSPRGKLTKRAKFAFLEEIFLIDDGRGKILNHIDMSMMVWGGDFYLMTGD